MDPRFVKTKEKESTCDGFQSTSLAFGGKGKSLSVIAEVRGGMTSFSVEREN